MKKMDQRTWTDIFPIKYADDQQVYEKSAQYPNYQHHWPNGSQFEQTPGDGEGHRSLACCSPWGCKDLYMSETEQQGYMSTYGVLLWEIQLIFYNKGSQYYCIHCSVFHPVWQSLSFNIFCQCNCSYAVCLITQLYPTLSNRMECSPPGSSVSGILQQEYWSG